MNMHFAAHSFLLKPNGCLREKRSIGNGNGEHAAEDPIDRSLFMKEHPMPVRDEAGRNARKADKPEPTRMTLSGHRHALHTIRTQLLINAKGRLRIWSTVLGTRGDDVRMDWYRYWMCSRSG